MRAGKAIVIEGNPSWMPEELRKRPEDLRISFRFSKPERRTLRKRKKVPVSEWCERHRVITMGAIPGRWKNEITPYLAGIMDASFFSSVESVIICAADQVGKSECVNNCIGYAIDHTPGPVLYVYPDEQTARENSRDRILPMIQSSARLKTYFTGAQDDEAALRINLQHMPIYMAWARSASRLANKPIMYEVLDETDKYPLTAGKREADPISKGEKRTRTYRWFRKIWKLSTPTIETGPIWTALTQEAQVVFDFWVRCPECRKYQRMEFTQIKWSGDERDPERMESEDLAWYECRHCEDRWDDHMRDMAVRAGQWRERVDAERMAHGAGCEGEGERKGLTLKSYLKQHRPRKIGFHIPAWLSRFVGLSECAAAFLKGQKDKNKLKDFNNSYAAVPWTDYTQERKEDRILDLRDDRGRGFVPGGGVVSCLTGGVDTQDNGFWYEVRAWGFGPDMESWQVREGYITTFEALEKVLFKTIYEDVDGNEFDVRFTVQDAMGHRTSEVYDFVRRFPGRIVAAQGVDNRRMIARHTWSNIEFYPGTKKPIRGGLKLLRADVNYYKNILAGKLEINPEDPGAWHMHSEMDLDWARHMCAEFINDKGLWECPASKANHGWDVSVYNLVAADVLGVKYARKTEIGGQRSEGGKDKEEKKGVGFIPRKKGWLKR